MYSTHRWINKHKHSALCLFLRNQLSCADQIRPDIVEPPYKWYSLWGRLWKMPKTTTATAKDQFGSEIYTTATK
jgi:hypothetical protein